MTTTHPQRVEREDALADLREAEDDAVHEAQGDGGDRQQEDLLGGLDERGLGAGGDGAAEVGVGGGVVEQLRDGERQREGEGDAQDRVDGDAEGGGQGEEPVALVEDADEAREAHQAREHQQRVPVGSLAEVDDAPRDDARQEQEEEACRQAHRRVRAAASMREGGKAAAGDQCMASLYAAATVCAPVRLTRTHQNRARRWR